MSTIFQRLFGSAQSDERGNTMQINTMDEIPIDDPDELAVEEEFKRKVATQAKDNGLKAETHPQPATTPRTAPVQTPPVAESTATPPAPQQPPAKPQQAKARPQPRPTQPPTPAPQPPRQPPVMTSSPDMARLQSLAKASGLRTSMDNVGRQNSMMFDIEVMETGDDGRPMVHVERGVTASSESELRHLYALSDQKINIIRTYGGNPAPPAAVTAPPSVSTTSPTPAVQSSTPVQPQIEKKEPPKFFNVSGVECKLENGKVYQRQWVRLAGADAESFRLVNDTNNKIVPIDGKHIEQKKWVLIQENAEEGI